MATEHVSATSAAPTSTTSTPGGIEAVVPETARTPVDENLIEVASALAPGKALDLGCGEGHNAVWLARNGWVVHGVDISAGAIKEVRAAASAARVRIVSDVADITTWRPVSRYDLVLCTLAVPPRGMGRSRMLEMAAAAVAPGGTILLTELDISLRKEGLAERYLVSTEELERHLGGFRIDRSVVRLARQRHGYEERVLPVAIVVATRRTDLRTF